MTEDGSSPTASGAALSDGRRGARLALFAAIAVAVVVVDQITKAWVDASFPLAWTSGPVGGLATPTPVVGDLVRIAKTYNDGGLFGFFDAAAPVLAIASLGVIALIVAYQVRTGSRSWLLTLALGLLLGGALGNLVDRMRYGHVIDWVDTGLGTFRWYTFNVADAAISVALLVLIVLAFAGDWLDRRRHAAAERGAARTTPVEQGAGR